MQKELALTKNEQVSRWIRSEALQNALNVRTQGTTIHYKLSDVKIEMY